MRMHFFTLATLVAIAFAPGHAHAGTYVIPATPEPCGDPRRPPVRFDLLCKSPEVWPIIRQERILDDRVRDNVPDEMAFDRHQTPYSMMEFPECSDAACLLSKYRDDIAWLNAQLAEYPQKRLLPPTPPNVARYIAAMSADTELAAIAYTARPCYFRSPAWHKSIEDGLLQEKLEVERKLSIHSQEENSAVERFEAGTRMRAMEAYPIGGDTCAKLRSSGEMERLDAFQWRVTGGYH